MGEALDWSTEVIFSADITQESAIKSISLYPIAKLTVLPQGRCVVPQSHIEKYAGRLCQKCPRQDPAQGSGGCTNCSWMRHVFIRKGVDVFLSCAAADNGAETETRSAICLDWSGLRSSEGLRLTRLISPNKSSALDLKVRSTSSTSFPTWSLLIQAAICFYLSSRLDPMPNVAIDAAFHGLPIVCFENASGIASLLKRDPQLKDCVVPYLDTHSAARAIVDLANDETAHADQRRLP